ncbi:protein kinase family protein [Kitasatospora aburaviensis]
MADGTKAVVDTSAADGATDEAALAAAIDELAGETAQQSPEAARTGTAPDDEPSPAPSSEETSEITAPLSAAEIRAELAAGGAKAAAAAAAARDAGARPARPPQDPQPTHDPRDTGTLPQTLPAPLRHSGDKIGNRYRLEECISQTETFSSWRAVDEKLRRAVGVHLMASGHQRARRVLAAAKSAALLGDPRFVQVLDAVQEGELVYVVREWLPHASDLAKLLANGPMEPHEAYQMVRQVTDAVAAAHRRGQAHLRLTPRCVLRTDSGQYRINGIAVDAALRGLPADGDAEDAERTDTRAIGALLFAALTHRWPYPEDRYDLQGLPRNLRDVPPDQVRAGVHKGLSELAARALFDHPRTTPGRSARRRSWPRRSP